MACAGWLATTAASGSIKMRESMGTLRTRSEVEAQSQIDASEVAVDVKGLIVGLQHHVRVEVETRAEGPDRITRLRPGPAVRGEPGRNGGEARWDALIGGAHVVMFP